jgi:hypothetical protein
MANLNFMIRSLLVNSNEVIWFASITRSGDIDSVGNFPTELEIITNKYEYIASFSGRDWWINPISPSFPIDEYLKEEWIPRSSASDEVDWNIEYLFLQWAFNNIPSSDRYLYCDQFYKHYNNLVKSTFGTIPDDFMPTVESAVFNGILKWHENEVPVYCVERVLYQPGYYGTDKRVFPILIGQPDNKGLKSLYKRFNEFCPDTFSFVRLVKYGSDGSKSCLKVKHNDLT